MKVAVIGTGYVGLITGTCLAEIGNEVICIDKDSKKIEKLNKGITPIYEEYLEDMVTRNILEGRLSFTASIKEGIEFASVVFIAVGTPSQENGDADLSQVDAAAKEIAHSMKDYKVIVNKSTVPVGTNHKVKNIIKMYSTKHVLFDVVSNPEFLREGRAIYDIFNADRIIIGSSSKRAAQILQELYQPLHQEIFVTSPESAEMIKYASNAFLATKISFINEIANICENVGADVSEVAKGMGMDKRIGNKFLNAGIGFGGACFPKDVKALIKIAESNQYDFKIIKQTLAVNERQKQKPIEFLERIFTNLQDVKIGILGLAFKPGTDDIREAPAITIIQELMKRGAIIKAYDPIAMDNMKSKLEASIEYCNDCYDAMKDCDAVLLLTEWDEFMNLDMHKAARLMNKKILIDGRNMLDSEKATKMGFKYYGIGKGIPLNERVYFLNERMIFDESEESNYPRCRAWN